jgi:histidinol-phosphate/aromatic aminotransferase/cobyric acid decarboxylase-like protein
VRGSLPPPGEHGGDGAAIAVALGVDPGAILDLSASFNPVAPDPAEVVAKHLDGLRRYPDADVATRALASALEVEPARVLLTNGGAQAIALVGAALGGTVNEPDFALYPRSSGPAGPGGHEQSPRWRSNPHNPTGTLAGDDERAGVWDEAFYPLATGGWTRGDADRGAVVVGSLTKVFACPGLRLGYVVAPDERLIAALVMRQPHWSVNGLATASLPGLLERADLPAWAATIAALRADLHALLDEHGLVPMPSDANFVLAMNAAGLRTRLAPHGVVVRDCASFGLPGCARIAVPDEAGLTRLAGALARSS